MVLRYVLKVFFKGDGEGVGAVVTGDEVVVFGLGGQDGRTINEHLEAELGFVRSYHDPCVYTKLDGRIYLPLYVDDVRLFYAGDDET